MMKERTKRPIAPYHRGIQKDISLFGGKWKDAKYGLVESDRVNMFGNEVKLIAQRVPNKTDRKLGDTILQLYVIHNKHTTDEGEYTDKPIKFNFNRGNIVQMKWSELFRELDLQDSPKNRLEIQSSMDNLRSLTVIGNDGKTVYDYTIFSGKELNMDSDTVDFEISNMFIKRFTESTMSWQRLDRIREVEDKVRNAGELAKYLIAHGSGTDKLPISKIKKKDLFRHQGLSHSNKTDQNIINRQLKAIAEVWRITYKTLDRGNYIKFDGTGCIPKKKEDKVSVSKHTIEEITAPKVEEDTNHTEVIEEVIEAPELEVYLGFNGMYILTLVDGEQVMYSTEEVECNSTFKVIPNPYIEESTEKGLDF